MFAISGPIYLARPTNHSIPPDCIAQLYGVARKAERVALMADGPLAYVMPIGGVASYGKKINVTGVGFDIACGNAAIRTDIACWELPADLNELADQFADELALRLKRARTKPAPDALRDHSAFKDAACNAIPPTHRNALNNTARSQLGTVGSGNHYVDVSAD